MPTPNNRQRMKPISLKMWPADLTRTERAAAMKGTTVSEYGRRAIEKANAELLGEPQVLFDPQPQAAVA